LRGWTSEGKTVTRGSAAGRRVTPKTGGTDFLDAQTLVVATAVCAWSSSDLLAAGEPATQLSFGRGTVKGQAMVMEAVDGLPDAVKAA